MHNYCQSLWCIAWQVLHWFQAPVTYSTVFVLYSCPCKLLYCCLAWKTKECWIHIYLVVRFHFFGCSRDMHQARFYLFSSVMQKVLSMCVMCYGSQLSRVVNHFLSPVPLLPADQWWWQTLLRWVVVSLYEYLVCSTFRAECLGIDFYFAKFHFYFCMSFTWVFKCLESL